MAFYNYRCDKCTIKDALLEKKEIFEDKRIYVYKEDEESCDLVWEERHGMMEDPVIRCPLCDKQRSKTLLGCETVFYVRGDGYLDKSGCKRDMNLYKLTKEDPYANMRQSGEADDLAQRLRNGGKHGYDKNGRRKTKFFTPDSGKK